MRTLGRLVLLLVVSLGPMRADAAEWVYFRGVRTAEIGLALGIAGPPAFVVGGTIFVASVFGGEPRGATGGAILGGAGLLAGAVGPPLLANGLTRARRALESVGARVDRTAEQAFLGLGVGTAVLLLATPFAGEILLLAATGTYALALLAGGMQLGVLRRAYWDLPWNRPVAAGTRSIDLVPVVGPRMQGIALAGTF